jgi:hypothetical protein
MIRIHLKSRLPGMFQNLGVIIIFRLSGPGRPVVSLSFANLLTALPDDALMRKRLFLTCQFKKL